MAPAGEEEVDKRGRIAAPSARASSRKRSASGSRDSNPADLAAIAKRAAQEFVQAAAAAVRAKAPSTCAVRRIDPESTLQPPGQRSGAALAGSFGKYICSSVTSAMSRPIIQTAISAGYGNDDFEGAAEAEQVTRIKGEYPMRSKPRSNTRRLCANISS